MSYEFFDNRRATTTRLISNPNISIYIHHFTVHSSLLLFQVTLLHSFTRFFKRVAGNTSQQPNNFRRSF